MILKVTLQSDHDAFDLPIHYNYFVQSALYNLLDKDFANFLHETGFVHGKRRFKLFTFSRLQGKYQVLSESGKIRYHNPVTLTVCSPMPAFCQSVMNGILSENGIHIGQVRLGITSVECNQALIKQQSIIVKTLSPVTVYSTLLRPDGRKYTLYHHPLTKDFQQQIQRNMLKKYQLVYQSNPITERFDIQPVASFKQRVSFYKEIIIKGYVGKFRLSADDPKLLSLALDTGLGAKGSLGFGCIEQMNVQEGEKAC